eukprot:4897310-Pyramimonas_sp.AAC.1
MFLFLCQCVGEVALLTPPARGPWRQLRPKRAAGGPADASAGGPRAALPATIQSSLLSSGACHKR